MLTLCWAMRSMIACSSRWPGRGSWTRMPFTRGSDLYAFVRECYREQKKTALKLFDTANGSWLMMYDIPHLRWAHRFWQWVLPEWQSPRSQCRMNRFRSPCRPSSSCERKWRSLFWHLRQRYWIHRIFRIFVNERCILELFHNDVTSYWNEVQYVSIGFANKTMLHVKLHHFDWYTYKHDCEPRDYAIGCSYLVDGGLQLNANLAGDDIAWFFDSKLME